MKKCLYCGCEIDESSVIDFCERCGINAFGEKMFQAIIENMNKAKENLYPDMFKFQDETNSNMNKFKE